jgi:rubrerythrin
MTYQHEKYWWQGTNDSSVKESISVSCKTPETIDELLDHVIDIFNNWEDDVNIEALQAFQQFFNLNNRFVCSDCGRTSSEWDLNECPGCGGVNIKTKVVNEFKGGK